VDIHIFDLHFPVLVVIVIIGYLGFIWTNHWIQWL